MSPHLVRPYITRWAQIGRAHGDTHTARLRQKRISRDRYCTESLIL